MPGEQSGTRNCDKCGASIADEDLRSQAAARYKGKTLCPKCTSDVKARIMAAKKAGGTEAPPADAPDTPVLVMEDILSAPDEDAPSQIHGFSGATELKQKEKEYRRSLLTGTRSATRCRTFHCKLTDASLQHLNEQVNEWVDEHDDIEIKYALSNIGVVEGKHSDPHMILTVFY